MKCGVRPEAKRTKKYPNKSFVTDHEEHTIPSIMIGFSVAPSWKASPFILKMIVQKSIFRKLYTLKSHSEVRECFSEFNVWFGRATIIQSNNCAQPRVQNKCCWEQSSGRVVYRVWYSRRLRQYWMVLPKDIIVRCWKRWQSFWVDTALYSASMCNVMSRQSINGGASFEMLF